MVKRTLQESRLVRMMKQPTFRLSRFEKKRQIFYVLFDLLMILTVLFNITWIVFDTLFVSEVFQNFLATFLPEFTAYYAEVIHPNFPTYDMIFVGIFLTEFFIRWAAAIYNHTYYRWFFFPFVHWYDLLGCIPIGSMRWLRLLRIFAVVYRLQKYKIFDFSNTYPVLFFRKYLDVVVEEISDRVVINSLNGIEDEIKEGHPVVERITKEVLVPQKELVGHWVTQKINDLKTSVYEPNREDFKKYVEANIRESMSQASNIKLISKIPVVGPLIDNALDDIVSDVVFNVTDKLLADLGSENTDVVVEQLTDQVMLQLTETSPLTNQVARDVLIRSLHIIKEEVAVQKWKSKDYSKKKKAPRPSAVQ